MPTLETHANIEVLERVIAGLREKRSAHVGPDDAGDEFTIREIVDATVRAAAETIEHEAFGYADQFVPRSTGYRTAAILHHAAQLIRSAQG